jgi:hypothetical protein
MIYFIKRLPILDEKTVRFQGVHDLANGVAARDGAIAKRRVLINARDLRAANRWERQAQPANLSGWRLSKEAQVTRHGKAAQNIHGAHDTQPVVCHRCSVHGKVIIHLQKVDFG